MRLQPGWTRPRRGTNKIEQILQPKSNFLLESSPTPKVYHFSKVDEQPLSDQPASLQPSLARAKDMYAKHNGLEPSAVTEEMLVNSDLGVEGWACHGMD